MNQYTNILSPGEAEELQRRSSRALTLNQCPTCRDTGTYTWNDEEHECEKDYDGDCIQFKLHRLYELANIPRLYQQLDWDEDFVLQPEAKHSIDEYLAHKDNVINNGVGLYIYSKGLGTGKTFIGTHILKDFVKSGYKGYYVPFFDILDLHQRQDDERTFVEDKLMGSPILVIDDVVKGKVSEKQADYYRMTLERVVRHRAHNAMPTIITSNLTWDELEKEYDRIFSLGADSMLPLELDSKIDTRISRGLGRRAKAMLDGETPPIT